MKKFFEIVLIIILSPLILIGLIGFLFESLVEMLVVKHTAYFKQNKLTIKEDYYHGILTDPVFKIKNLICKYRLEYDVISIDAEKVHLVINKNNECVLIHIRMKNFYCENNELYFQKNTDEGTTFKVEEYLEQSRIDNYTYDKCKLLVLKEFVSEEDYKELESNPSILLIKEVKKDFFNYLQ